MKSSESDNRQLEVSRVASLGQSGGESMQLSQPSPLTSEYCVDLLRDLSNTFAAVLMNAQVLDGKLPSYSRSKRYIHEIERSAQRGGAQLKRLLVRLSAEGAGTGDRAFGSEKVPPVAERSAVAANQGPTATADSALELAPPTAAHAAPAFVDQLMGAHRGM